MNTMELRLWHTQREGWVREHRHTHPNGVKQFVWVMNGGQESFDDIYRDTIDDAAAAMPYGWDWWKTSGEWLAQAAGTPFERVKDTGDEIHDRYLLAKLAWEAMGPTK